MIADFATTSILVKAGAEHLATGRTKWALETSSRSASARYVSGRRARGRNRKTRISSGPDRKLVLPIKRARRSV